MRRWRGMIMVGRIFEGRTRIGTMDRMACGRSRQLLGVRQTSAAFLAVSLLPQMHLGPQSDPPQSARGLAHSKTWRVHQDP